MPAEYFADPVSAYQHLGPHYSEVAARRAPYLRAVDALVLSRIPPYSRSLLDIGAGNGTRIERIGETAGISRIVLLEPATAMLEAPSSPVEHWPMRAEDLQPQIIGEHFDVITCLWNVLGHIPTGEWRSRAMRNVAQLLAPRGLFCLDITHRYNARSYGWFLSCARWVRDLLSANEKNGDVTATWQVNGQSISTYGHVFTHRETLSLAHAAGLEVQERIIVDYQSGKTRHLSWNGNFFYVFQRSSRTESASAVQTS